MPQPILDPGRSHGAFIRRIVLVCVLLAAISSRATARAAGPSCGGPASGGDWPMYGRDAANSRRQPEESTLTPSRVAALQPRWRFTTGRPSGAPAVDLADLNSTPIEAGGCVYVGAATATA